MIRLAVFIGLLWSTCASACGTTGQVMASPENEAPVVEVFLEDMKLAQPFSIKIQVCDAKIEQLSVDAIMPAHQHGMNYTPTVVDLGGGKYRADGMLFHMPGIWEVRVELTQETGVIRYTRTTTLR